MKEKLKFFAANGKERTVYTVTEIGADEYKIQITMEPNRLRPDIPEFAGLYYEFDESLDLGRKQKLAVDIELQHRVLDSRLGFLAQRRVVGYALKGSDWLLVHLIVKVQSSIVIPCRTGVPCNHHFRLFAHKFLLFRSRKTRHDTSILYHIMPHPSACRK